LISAFLPLTYLAATVGFPLLDERLAHIDATWFDVDWDQASAWIRGHPWFDAMLQEAYGSIFWQGAVVLVIASITCPGERNSESLWLFIISLGIIPLTTVGHSS
jgi:hypothetical protein